MKVTMKDRFKIINYNLLVRFQAAIFYMFFFISLYTVIGFDVELYLNPLISSLVLMIVIIYFTDIYQMKRYKKLDLDTYFIEVLFLSLTFGIIFFLYPTLYDSVSFKEMIFSFPALLILTSALDSKNYEEK